MTNEEIRRISNDLYAQLGLTDFMRLERMMEHKILEIYAPSEDYFEHKIYDKIKKEMGVEEE